MNKFTVDRSKWYRGRGPVRSLLLNAETGMQCCVGFQCLAAGMTLEQISGFSDISSIVRSRIGPIHDTKYTIQDSLKPMCPYDWNSDIAGKIYGLNDDSELTDAIREKNLTDAFAEIGWEVEFIN